MTSHPMPTLLLKRSARIRNALVTLLAGLPSAMAAVV